MSFRNRLDISDLAIQFGCATILELPAKVVLLNLLKEDDLEKILINQPLNNVHIKNRMVNIFIFVYISNSFRMLLLILKVEDRR